ncbi:hypothetical protein AFCDBAGC_3079 [Methylobacterium cerastii]|uniref:(2Fe-2S) ferredoxin domain-containing protein n=1 Tax=Methylobacterium cerastii TaxID=932741 RepID=A0ABQ4QIY0_9HYPH|nr:MULTISPECIES: (2Fe-2S) ferredoxin domain-containing protein [Methylobacterium]GJD45208.1 hypothetical protein AFCDBAGC_3079 [Methylobacterium cerastii]
MKPDPADRTPPPTVRTAKAKFSEVVAVCTKCAKRQGLSKRAIRDRVKAGLKQGGSGAKLRVVETGCLGPCPKRLVAVATGASVAAGRILLIDPTASPDAIVALLLPPRANLGQDERDDARDAAA